MATNSEKFKDYRKMLQELSNGLVETAKAQKRNRFSINGLLREYYDIVGKQLHTFEEWKEQNYSIRKGEHAYQIWDKPKDGSDGKKWCPIRFVFSEDQVMLNAVAA